MLVIIPSSMEAAMKRDLDRLRDSLPEDERDAFEAERHIHRQAIIDFYAETGTYPEICGVEKRPEEPDPDILREDRDERERLAAEWGDV